MSPLLPNAGKCDKCGFYKTWLRRVENPKTGKQMPAHINTKEDKPAEILGEGYCPDFKDNKPQTASTFHEELAKAATKPDPPVIMKKPADPAEAGTAGYLQLIIDAVEGYYSAVEANAGIPRYVLMVHKSMGEIKRLAQQAVKELKT